MAVGLHSTKPRQLILPIRVAAERALYRRRHLAALSTAGVETEVAEAPLGVNGTSTFVASGGSCYPAASRALCPRATRWKHQDMT